MGGAPLEQILTGAKAYTRDLMLATLVFTYNWSALRRLK
jgi:hypothetical protein